MHMLPWPTSCARNFGLASGCAWSAWVPHVPREPSKVPKKFCHVPRGTWGACAPVAPQIARGAKGQMGNLGAPGAASALGSALGHFAHLLARCPVNWVGRPGALTWSTFHVPPVPCPDPRGAWRARLPNLPRAPCLVSRAKWCTPPLCLRKLASAHLEDRANDHTR